MAGVEQMNRSLVEIQDYTQQLKTSSDNLNNQLSSLKTQIFSTIDNSCPGSLTADCSSTRTKVNSIAIKPNFYSVSKKIQLDCHTWPQKNATCTYCVCVCTSSANFGLVSQCKTSQLTYRIPVVKTILVIITKLSQAKTYLFNSCILFSYIFQMYDVSSQRSDLSSSPSLPELIQRVNKLSNFD